MLIVDPRVTLESETLMFCGKMILENLKDTLHYP